MTKLCNLLRGSFKPRREIWPRDSTSRSRLDHDSVFAEPYLDLKLLPLCLHPFASSVLSNSMMLSRRSAIISQWKQLGRVCRSASHGSTTRVPSVQIIGKHNDSHPPLTTKEDIRRRSYATEARGMSSAF